MKLSIVFPSLNEPSNAIATAQSILNTVGHFVEIVCVNDGGIPIDFGNMPVICHENSKTIGIGPSRHIGAMIATGSHLLLCDSHMVFKDGWYDEVAKHIFDRPKTVHCGSMLALKNGDTECSQSTGVYYGGTFVFNAMSADKRKVFEVIWQQEKPGDDYEIPAVMGAQYFVPRDWYLKLSPHRHMKGWGLDEESLSLKSWLAGGDVRLLKNVKIGHKFRAPNDPKPVINQPDLIYNRLFLIETLMPEPHRRNMVSAMKSIYIHRPNFFYAACSMLEDNRGLVEIEREANRKILVRGFDSFLAKFNLSV
jgi:glycosyltransferase involved in cell wall biosynthesis